MSKITGQPMEALPMPPYGAASQPPQSAGVRVKGLVEVGTFIAASEHGVGVQWGDLGPLGTGDKLYALEPQQEEAVAWVPVNPQTGQYSLSEAVSHFRQDWADDLKADGWIVRPLYAHPTPVQKVQESQTVSKEMRELINASRWVYEKLASETATVTIFDQDRLGNALAALEISHVR